MAQIEYRANLSADDIPLLSASQGQTVIVGKFDQDYTLDSNPNNVQRLQKEKQIADAYYAHNVLPTGEGYRSIGFLDKIAGVVGETSFDRIFTLRDINENKSFFSPAGGANFIFDKNRITWQSTNPLVAQENTLVTVAYLSGETYIYYSKVGCFKYDKVLQQLVPVVLTGLVAAQVNGICSANGFMLAWDDLNNVYRSQSASPLNFTPDSSLGSGAGVPEDIRGKIVILLPISNGFIVYTTANAVGATFQQNIRYPFIFKEIEGSSGLISVDHVSWQDNLGEHYFWSKAGLLKVNKSKAMPVFPKITDFLVAKIFEDFDTTTNTFTISKLLSQLNVKVTSVGSKYVVISYGIDQFTHAIIYDLAYKRFGKVKIDHVDCFNYYSPNLSGDLSWDGLQDLTWDDLGLTTWDQLGTQIQTADQPKEIVAFMNNDGSISIINFELTHVTGDVGVLVLGKYQFSRANLLCLDEIAIENIEPGSDFELVLLTSLDGKNTKYTSRPFNDINQGQFRHYQTDKTGKNHSLVAKNTFNISSLQLVFHPTSRA